MRGLTPQSSRKSLQLPKRLSSQSTPATMQCRSLTSWSNNHQKKSKVNNGSRKPCKTHRMQQGSNVARGRDAQGRVQKRQCRNMMPRHCNGSTYHQACRNSGRKLRFDSKRSIPMTRPHNHLGRRQMRPTMMKPKYPTNQVARKTVSMFFNGMKIVVSA